MTRLELEHHLAELRAAERITGYDVQELPGIVLIGLQLSWWALLTPWRLRTTARGLALELEPKWPFAIALCVRARFSTKCALIAAAASVHRQLEPCPGCPLCCAYCASATGGQCREHQEPECTCYELIGGHQQGCAFYGRRRRELNA